MIVSAIVALRHVPQPYRGMVDGGVVLGLGLGLISLLVHFARSLNGTAPEVPADMPPLPARVNRVGPHPQVLSPVGDRAARGP
jgi:hypothetical protein